MRRLRAPGFLLAFSLIFLLSGCAIGRWFSKTPQPQTQTNTADFPPTSPTPSPTDQSSPSQQWDFSQRQTEEEPRETTRSVRQEVKAAPPSLPPAPSSQPGSSGRRSLIPGLSRDKEEPESNPQYVTEEDLLKIVTEFQRIAGKDAYRFSAPKDVTGANVYKATLTRLQDYEAKHPGAYTELIAFTRGRAYEGLQEYDKAIEQYQIVSHSKHRLNSEASKASAALSQFQELKQRPLTATTPVAYLQSLDEQIAAWQNLQKQYADTPYEALAREEEERLDCAKVAFLVINRYRLEDGNESVVLAYRQLITKHKESKNAYRYQLEFADFYFTLAQEYVAQSDPQGLQFDSATFEDLGRTALRLYSQIAQEDGVMEKLEAKGKLEALEAYMAKIGRLAR